MDTNGRDMEWVRITVQDESARPLAAAGNADRAARREGFALYSARWYEVACSSYYTMTGGE